MVSSEWLAISTVFPLDLSATVTDWIELCASASGKTCLSVVFSFVLAILGCVWVMLGSAPLASDLLDATLCVSE